MKHKFNFVYLTTHIDSGKQYIGSHSTNNIDDGYIGSGIILENYLKKFGKEAFKREILQICKDNREARTLEGFYIEKYKTLKPNGMNISPAGGLGFIGCHSEESKQNISESLKKGFSSGNRSQWNTNKKLEKSHIEKISKSVSKAMKEGVAQKISNSTKGTKNPFYGKKHTSESMKKMSIFRKNKSWEEIYGIKSSEMKDKWSKRYTGKNNNMAGKTLMDVWTIKYGEEKALLRYIEWKENLKKSSNKNK